MFWYDFHAKICISFNVVALMMEINSFFLHSRKLLQMANFSFDHWFYKIVVYLNLFTFLIFRGYPSARITYGMFVEAHLVPKLYIYGIYISMFIMNGINPVLFWRLFRNDILRNWGRKPESKKHALLNGNNNLLKNNTKLQ